MTTNHQQQTTTSSHTCISNLKPHVSSRTHPPQLVRGNILLLSQYLCGASEIGSACFGRLSSSYFSCRQEKSTFLLITFNQKRICFFGVLGTKFLFSWYFTFTFFNPIFSIAQTNSLVPRLPVSGKKLSVSRTLNSTQTISSVP